MSPRIAVSYVHRELLATLSPPYLAMSQPFSIQSRWMKFQCSKRRVIRHDTQFVFGEIRERFSITTLTAVDYLSKKTADLPAPASLTVRDITEQQSLVR